MSDDDLDRQEAVPVPPRLGELQELVDELILAVEGARNVPLSSSVMLDRNQLLDMLYRLRDELPDELRAARWMVREREAFVARTNEKARELLERARQRSEQMVSESYIVKEAVEEANSLIRRAEAEAHPDPPRGRGRRRAGLRERRGGARRPAGPGAPRPQPTCTRRRPGREEPGSRVAGAPIQSGRASPSTAPGRLRSAPRAGASPHRGRWRPRSTGPWSCPGWTPSVPLRAHLVLEGTLGRHRGPGPGGGGGPAHLPPLPDRVVGAAGGGRPRGARRATPRRSTASTGTRPTWSRRCAMRSCWPCRCGPLCRPDCRRTLRGLRRRLEYGFLPRARRGARLSVRAPA